MPFRPPGPLVLGIITALEREGEMTRVELRRTLDLGRDGVSGVISRMNKASLHRPKRIYIVRWVNEDDEGQNYLRAVYALGDKRDARKPKAKTSTERTFLHRTRKRGRASSVFNWAQPLYKRGTTV